MENHKYKSEFAWKYFNEKKMVANNDDRKIIIVANNLNTPENIGALIRVAGNVGCEKIIFTGDITDFKKSKIQKAATNGFDKVDWMFCKEEEWPSLIPEGFSKIAIETTDNATDIYTTELPDKVVLIVGNESYGISNWSHEQCDSAVYIPMPGIVKSLNVSQAGVVAAFEWWRRGYIGK
jgi:tRNA G18 (ribose-2'-O)-methylase SpoU